MKHKLFLISGHSGSGKSSIMKELMSNELISFTTRPKREGEIDGQDYHFITREEYNNMYNNGELAEWTKYDGNYYGLSANEIKEKMSKGHGFVIVDRNGAEQMLKAYDNCVTIILHTSKEDAVKQMLDRGDKMESINKRMLTYNKEISNKQHYDYAVLNRYGEFEKTKYIVGTIISKEVE